MTTNAKTTDATVAHSSRSRRLHEWYVRRHARREEDLLLVKMRPAS